MTTLKLGDSAVFYGKGVGIITAQEDSDPRGNPCKIFVLKLEKSTARVRADNPDTCSIRSLMDKETVTEVYEVLADRKTIPSQTTWNRRYREYVQNIQSGEPINVAKVLRDLELLSIKKSLSFGESKIYSQAKSLVIEEIAHVQIQAKIQKELKTIESKEDLKQLFSLIEEYLPDAKDSVEKKIYSLFEEERKAVEAKNAEAEAGKKKKKTKKADKEA